MLLSMRIRSAMWNRLASAVIPVAFIAALPLVQWCSLCVDPGPGRCPMSGGDAAAAPERSEPACTNGCEHGIAEGECPFAHATHRTFCVGAAMGGPGVRPLAPGLPVPLAALPVAAPSIEDAAREPRWVAPDIEPPPPTSAHGLRPPARAPPSS